MNRFRPAVSLVAALVLSGVVSGCGSDAAPTAATPSFDTAPPSTPTELAYTTDSGSPVLSWDPSAAADVAGYQVFVYAPSPEHDSAWMQLFEVPSSTTSITLWAVSGHVTQYYRVRAVDGAGNTSALTPRIEVVREPVDPGTDGPLQPGDTPAREE